MRSDSGMDCCSQVGKARYMATAQAERLGQPRKASQHRWDGNGSECLRADSPERTMTSEGVEAGLSTGWLEA